jgi:hypothetical protein
MPLHARPVVGSKIECRTYRPGRVCQAEGCTTVLSIYNAASLCSLHEGRNTRLAARPRRLSWT